MVQVAPRREQLALHMKDGVCVLTVLSFLGAASLSLLANGLSKLMI